MPTTALLVEIVIVGFTFFLSLLPAAAIVFQVRPDVILLFYSSIPIQFQLAAAYAAGVIWNRICDVLFSRFDDKIVLSMFASKKVFQAARIEVVMEGEAIRDYMGNFRSLIRVTRATTILLLIYAIAIPIYLYGFFVLKEMGGWNAVAIIVFELFLTSSSSYAWYRLERGYISAVKDAYKVVEKKTKKTRTNKEKGERL